MEMRSVKGVGYFAAGFFNGTGTSAVNAFATRIGGVSAAPFNALDFGNSLKERQVNLARLGSALGVEPLECVFVKQVHGNRVVELDPVNGLSIAALAATEADAVVTVTPGIAVGVLTADCLPVLLHDPVTGASAAVHAGWRGTFSRIVGTTVAFMVKEYGVRPVNLHAALGPCIGRCCYSVQRDFYENFIAEFGIGIESSFTVNASEITFDLQSANCAELIDAGVTPERINSVRHCTCCNPELFFSYRRDVTKAGFNTAKTGRQLSLVMASVPESLRVV